MTETFTAVGFESPWVLAIAPIPAIFGSAWKRRKTSGKWSFSSWEAAFVAYFSITVFVGIPMMWILGGALVALGVYFLAFERRIKPFAMRLAFAAVFIAFAIGFQSIGAMGPKTKIVLGRESMTYDFLGMNDSISRKNLQIDVVRPSQGVMARPWASWVMRGDNSLGLPVAGMWVYWGPHGLIRGDDLALHLAKWAGVKAVDKSYMLSWTKADWDRDKVKWQQEKAKKLQNKTRS